MCDTATVSKLTGYRAAPFWQLLHYGSTMSPPTETVRRQQPLESSESEPETRFTPPVEMSLGNLDIPPNAALRRQAGEIESFQPLDLNCENTMSTLTIPELLESLDFQLEGGIATLPVPSTMRTWILINKQLAFIPPFNRCLTLQKPNAILIPNPKPTISIGSRHEIKADYYTIWLSNPDSVFAIQVCSSTYVQFTSHLVMALISDFFEHFKKLLIKTKKLY